MYRIMIVDDEPIFVEYLKRKIDFKRHRAILCGCADDGAEALNQIRIKKPDIVFMDINMPNKNGLEVCEILVKLEDAPHVLILTAHDEFEFAHKAIKLGVFDYLLKPFDEQEITSSLDKCIADIEKRNEEKRLLMTKKEDSIGIQLKRAIEFEPKIDYEELQRQLGGQSYVVSLTKNIDKYGMQELETVFEKVLDLKTYDVGTYQSMKAGVHVLSGMQTIENIKEVLLNVKYKHLYEYIAFGECVQRLEKLHRSYGQAIIGIENRVHMSQSIIDFSDINYLDDKKQIYTLGDVQILIKYFESGKYDKADLIIERMFGVAENVMLSFQYVVTIYFSVLTNIYNYYKKRNETVVEQMAEQGRLLNELNICNTVGEIFETIKNYIYEALSDCLEGCITDKTNQLVNKMDSYLYNNYFDKELSVPKISKELFFENSYLRRIYKMQNNKTIMQALEEIRMNKAMEYLKETEDKLNDIAYKIGFSDPFYFSRRFKLYTNMSPKEYRDINKQQ